MKNYQSFIRYWLTTVVLMTGVILLLNFYLDPNDRYHFRPLPEDLAALAQSDDLVYVTPGNFDDRSLLKAFIKSGPRHAAVMIGGSRVMNFEPDKNAAVMAGGFLNAGVSAGSVKDYIAIWQILKQADKTPATVFLCVDPQALNRAQQTNLWLSIEEYYLAFFKTGFSLRYSIAAVTSQIKDMLSLQTTLASFQRIGKKHSWPAIIERSEYDGRKPARQSNFAMLYPAEYEKKPPSAVEYGARANGKWEVLAFKNAIRNDQEYFNLLSMLIKDMRDQGVRVALVLMPTHPLALDLVKGDALAAENLDFFRKKLIEISSIQQIPYFDGFAETEAGRVVNEDFSDGVHLKTGPNRAFFSRVSRALKVDSF